MAHRSRIRQKDSAPSPRHPLARVKEQNDGWMNFVTGLGLAGKDKRMHGNVGVVIPFREPEVEELYTADNIARRLVELLPYEAFRRFLNLTGMEEDTVSDINRSMDMLQMLPRFQLAAEWARLYGGSGVYVSVDDGQSNIGKPIDMKRLKRINGLIVLNRWELWSQYTDLETNINDPNFGYPRRYYLQPRRGLPFSQEPVKQPPKNSLTPTPPREADKIYKALIQFNAPIHASRIIRFDGKKLPIRKRAQNNYWEDSVFTSVFEVLRDYQISHATGANIVQDFSIAVWKIKELTALLAAGKEADIKKRAEIMAFVRNTLGMNVIGENEEMEWKNRTITGLPELLDRISKRFQAYTDIPHTILFNESPSGLGATGNHEEKMWYNIVNAYQKIYLSPRVNRFYELLFNSKEGPTKGTIPDQWGYEWLPLFQPTELEVAQTRKAIADADQIYVDMGLPAEVVIENRFGGDKFAADIKLPPGFKFKLPPVNQEEEDPLSGQGSAKKEKMQKALADAAELIDATPGRAVQTIIISKKKVKTEEEARKLVAKFGGEPKKVDQTEESWRFRQREPSEFTEGGFKTFQPVTGISIVYGKLK